MNFFKFFREELCILGLGSNLPYRGRSPLELLSSALGELGKILARGRASSIYRTAPLHVTDQGDFLNCGFCGYFRKEPPDLLARTQAIEASFGRDRSRERRWGERTLDIDILLFGTRIVRGPDLTVPHPRLGERSFALMPLLELLPGAREPGTGKKYRDILRTLPDQGVEVFTTPSGPGILIACGAWRTKPPKIG
ncbi:MAG: 2-amino-4-hydroxy-6-hydroxymethyldihydropteridine diphosphokinase [Spirochaetaceae bacterium]|jgi:2-amino-4-hydroxy-6-hydroxymethyldihydropteridine diphosphokinase|nr:2-amino-4-hydroxy-6-hydroxymethyldihydropteridine diphosphokinase [Spirochaetaceae bacterium]